MENKWWTQKAEEIQRFADTNDTQKFYEALKSIWSNSACRTPGEI